MPQIKKPKKPNTPSNFPPYIEGGTVMKSERNSHCQLARSYRSLLVLPVLLLPIQIYTIGELPRVSLKSIAKPSRLCTQERGCVPRSRRCTQEQDVYPGAGGVPKSRRCTQEQEVSFSLPTDRGWCCQTLFVMDYWPTNTIALLLSKSCSLIPPTFNDFTVPQNKNGLGTRLYVIVNRRQVASFQVDSL